MRCTTVAIIAAAACLAVAVTLAFVLGPSRCLRLPEVWPWDSDADLAANGCLALFAASALLTVTCALICCCSTADGAPRDSLDSASLASKLSFWWATPTLVAALRNGKLEPSDLPQLPLADRPERLYERFVRAWGGSERERRRRGPYRLLAIGAYATQRAVFLQASAMRLSYELAGGVYRATTFCATHDSTVHPCWPLSQPFLAGWLLLGCIPSPIRSDPFGCLRMPADALRCLPIRSDAFRFVLIPSDSF